MATHCQSVTQTDHLCRYGAVLKGLEMFVSIERGGRLKVAADDVAKKIGTCEVSLQALRSQVFLIYSAVGVSPFPPGPLVEERRDDPGGGVVGPVARGTHNLAIVYCDKFLESTCQPVVKLEG